MVSPFEWSLVPNGQVPVRCPNAMLALAGRIVKRGKPGSESHGYAVESHRCSHRVTPQTARTDLLALAKLKLLEAGKRGRALVFYAPRDLRARIESAARQPGRQQRGAAK